MHGRFQKRGLERGVARSHHGGLSSRTPLHHTKYQLVLPQLCSLSPKAFEMFLYFKKCAQRVKSTDLMGMVMYLRNADGISIIDFRCKRTENVSIMGVHLGSMQVNGTLP